MASSPRGIVAISPGDRIVQLLLLPSLHSQFPAQKQKWGGKGFGSSGNPTVFLSLDLDQRPLIELNVNGKQIMGLLDTEADSSIVAIKDWPSDWPIQQSALTLQGLGYAKTPDMSAQELPGKDQEGHQECFQPYVLELPVSLWGRDLLRDMRLRVTNEGQYSKASQEMMRAMGWHPSHDVGKYLQGHNAPITPAPRKTRQGLGFS
ncbi:endogenous retrovirus group K member 104 Pro protein-like [Arvicanthis niloticus]|uniref:endogenous retrovirus group K member 104 Pro protein-like n=1 Tax=Arvicanthis niloticus TaxID=61156 RepID=UPI0014862B3E|nr:endogenous retrovirus group K member 104 Pro protein-like [Arvicanthis niloticus]